MTYDKPNNIIFSAKNGVLVHTHPIAASDAPQLIEIFANMGTESRYRRFHQTLNHISDGRILEEAEKIAQADPGVQFGFIAYVESAEAGHRPIAAARYVKISADTAESAMSVRDDWQNQGIGTTLLLLLTEHAAAAGLSTLVAYIQNSNEIIWHLLSKLPYEVRRAVTGDESYVEIDLTRPRSLPK